MFKNPYELKESEWNNDFNLFLHLLTFKMPTNLKNLYT